MLLIRYIIVIIFCSVLFVCATFIVTKNFFCDCSVEKKESPLKIENIPNEKVELSNCEIWVDVGGSVKNPGVVCLPSESILNDAVKQAGGLNLDFLAYRYVAQRVNFAQKLENHQKIYIPFENETSCVVIQNEEDASYDDIVNTPSLNEKVIEACISINSASREGLDSLKGVGLSTADKIINGRPYSQLEELKEISGISDKIYDGFKDAICL